MPTSWTPANESTSLMLRRLTCDDPLHHEVVMMQCWQAVNAFWFPYEVPVYVIARNSLSKAAGELPLTSVPPSVFQRISATVHWSSTNTGSGDYKAMRKQGLKNVLEVKNFANMVTFGKGQLEVVIDETMHYCSPECHRLRYFLFDDKPRQKCLICSAPEGSKNIFYRTVAWLLSETGQKFYDEYLQLLALDDVVRERMGRLPRVLVA